jgi:hypothetical protein
MIMLNHHAIMQDLGSLEHLLQVDNWAAGGALPMQDVYPVHRCLQAQFGVENNGERLTVRSA